MQKQTIKPNRLIYELSPYLRQHAYNPVDWFPWSEEAFRKARTENKPIFLSCGYSACHWCHVMEKESFSNSEVAEMMNQYFVNIKIDREERPDLDQLFQESVRVLTGQGGWPLSIFLDFEGHPFFGGTYFPLDSLKGRISFPDLLRLIYEKWTNNHEEIVAGTQELSIYLKKLYQSSAQKSIPDKRLSTQALEALIDVADKYHGGFGGAPKFPNPTLLSFFLRGGLVNGNTMALNHALFTLDRMAKGGIYDQIGGGFHRYSTDSHWLIPHFEKMLYDNAQLIKIYSMAYQLTNQDVLKEVVMESCNYIKRVMTSSEGGYYTAQDADSEGVEGKYYLWTESEIRQILPSDLTQVFIDYYQVTPEGNFEEKSILNRLKPNEKRSDYFALKRLINEGRENLLRAREKREKPFRDEKVITSWNGLMIGALAYAYQVFGQEEYYLMAGKTANFCLKVAHLPDGSLARIYKDGQAKGAGFLDDYVFLAQGLIELYEADFNEYWLEQSLHLTNEAMNKFSDHSGRYYLTSNIATDLFTRPLSGIDQAIPSGISIHAENLIKLASYTGEQKYIAEAEKIFYAYSSELRHEHWGYAGLINALDMLHRGIKEFVFITEDGNIPEMLVKLRQKFLPYRIIVWRDKSRQHNAERHPSKVLLHGRDTLAGRPTCYVCSDYRCLPPITEWEDLNNLLK